MFTARYGLDLYVHFRLIFFPCTLRNWILISEYIDVFRMTVSVNESLFPYAAQPSGLCDRDELFPLWFIYKILICYLDYQFRLPLLQLIIEHILAVCLIRAIPLCYISMVYFNTVRNTTIYNYLKGHIPLICSATGWLVSNLLLVKLTPSTSTRTSELRYQNVALIAMT